MAAIRDIRRHIRSISNIQKITKTMEMVAAARMRKTTAALLASRPYAQLAWNLLLGLSTRTEHQLHSLLQARPIRNVLVILITSDRGLCGSFNVGLIHKALSLVTDKNTFHFLTVGKKGRDFLMRRGYHVIAEFSSLQAPVSFLQIMPIGQIVISEYMAQKVDEVYIVYSNFVSNLVQKPSTLHLLPLRREQVDKDAVTPFTYEPSPELVLSTLVSRIIEYEIYAAVLESQTSEFAARMIAMKNATENAEQLIDDLTLSYNKARQESITKELIELSTSQIVIEES